jgi:hypothetical protein
MAKKLPCQLSVLPVKVSNLQQADSAIQKPFSLTRRHQIGQRRAALLRQLSEPLAVLDQYLDFPENI